MNIIKAEEGIDRAVELLREGGIVGYPTETFYGLGVNAEDEDAVERLFTLKERPSGKPFPLLIPERKTLFRFVKNVPTNADQLMSTYWPGPLTIVLPAQNLSPTLINGKGGIAFRISQHPIALALTRLFDGPITTTSANRAEHPPVTEAGDVADLFRNEEILILDGGKTPGGLPSTVVDISPANELSILREGSISASDIRSLGMECT